MCQPTKWWWGLPILAALWLLAGLIRGGPINADLTERSTAAARAEQAWATIRLEGRDAAIAGVAPTPEARAAAAALIDGVPGVRLVNDGASVLAAVSPWTWGAVRDGNRITLTGFAPDAAAKARIAADARTAVPAAEIVDQMQVARGVTPVYGAATSYALAQIARLPDGKAALSDTTLTVTGTAPSLDGYQAAIASGIPAGFGPASKLDVALPTIRPYVWQAAKAGSTITLTGLAPSAELKARLAAAAAAAAPGGTVIDLTRLAAGAPAGLEAMATAAFGHLSALSTGSAGFSDAAYTLAGAAPTVEAYQAVTTASRALPQGFTLAGATLSGPTASPYVWSATRNGNAVTLSGSVPDAAIKSANVAAVTAAIPGAQVTDQQQLALGAPNGFAAAASYAISQLSRLVSGEASLSDAAFSLRGAAASLSARDAIAAAASRLPEGFSLGRADISSPTINPYVWSATRNASAITLSGYVPDEATRTANVAAARAAVPDALLTDQQQLGAGAPNGFAEMSAFGIGQLTALTSGTASLSNTAYTLTGAAPTIGVRDQTVASSNRLPAGFSLARQEVTAPPPPPPPPAPPAAPAIVAVPPPPPPAPPAPPVAVVAVEPPPPPPLPVVPVPPAAPVPPPAAPFIPAPPASPPAPPVAVVAVEPPPPPPLPVVPLPPVVAVAPPSPPAAVTPAPPAVTAPTPPVAVIPPPPPPVAPAPRVVAADTCQPRFNALLRDPILFDTNGDTIRPESFALLTRLAAVAKSCPSRTIEIAAHTDSDGPDIYNQDLSERRAQAVAAYLTREGVAAGNLRPVGYGESRPLVPNDSPANKQKNRRVEFTVK